MNLVISLRRPLEQRFGTQGFGAIRAALSSYGAALPEPPAIVFLDDAETLEPFGQTPVGPTPEAILGSVRRLRAAVGGIDTICLLGSEHIVPTWQFPNPVGDRHADPDALVLTDNPYGTDADSLEQYLSPDVAVGRFVEPAGRDPAAFVAAIDGLADNHRLRRRAPGSAVFFNAEWTAPTRSVASHLPAAVDEHQAPGYEVTSSNRDDLARGFLYFNLHGFPEDPSWKAFSPVLGQFSAVVTPDGIEGADLAGAVVFAENCYGSVTSSRRRSCAAAMLEHGVAAFVGATGLSFGSHIQPDLLLDHADFLAQRFFQHCVSGARPGDALVAARRDYVNDGGVSLANPFKQKTLLQYRLLGDPALN